MNSLPETLAKDIVRDTLGRFADAMEGDGGREPSRGYTARGGRRIAQSAGEFLERMRSKEAALKPPSRVKALVARTKTSLSRALAGAKAQGAKTMDALKTAGRMLRGETVSDTDRASAKEALADIGRMAVAGSVLAAPGGALALAVIERAAKHFGTSVVPSGFRQAFAVAKAAGVKRKAWTDAELDAVLAVMAGSEKAEKAAPSERPSTPYRMEKARRRVETAAEKRLTALFAERLERQHKVVLALVGKQLAKAAPTKLSEEQILKAIADPLTGEIEKALEQVFREGGKLQADALGLRFDDADPAVQEWLHERATNLEDVLDSYTAERVKDVIAEGYTAAEGERDVLNRVRDLTDPDTGGPFTDGRAQRIARTEVHAAVMGGSHTASVQAGVTERSWLSAPDARPSHQEASGQRVGIDKPFQVGEAKLMYPGDPDGGAGYPGEVINCFLPDTIIEGKVIAGIRSRYKGKAVEIRTRTGRVLRVTPNHPIPVDRIDPRSGVGANHQTMLPACELAPGNKIVVSTMGVAWSGRRDDIRRPCEASVLFDDIASRGGSCQRNTRADDFHGDGQGVDPSPEGSRIAVISPADPTPIFVGLLSTQTIDLFDGGEWSPSHDNFRHVVEALVYDHASSRYFRPDEVESVKEFDHEGNVYDFESPHGWVVANGVLCGNCRCTTLEYFDDATSPDDLAEALDLDGDDDDALDTVREAAESLDDRETARIDPDDVDSLSVRPGKPASRDVKYDVDKQRLTVGGDAAPSAVRDAVREHLINSLMTDTDARGVRNQLALYALPEAKGGTERERAVRIVSAAARDDQKAVEAMTGEKLTDDEWDKLRAVAGQFWVGHGNRGEKPEKR